ncbi:rngB [Symbiodinium sp. CCMP2592]|nr:rngB [Symbiodinium sp. CCMP2592]
MLVLPVTSAMSLPPALPATDLDNAAEMCPPFEAAGCELDLSSAGSLRRSASADGASTSSSMMSCMSEVSTRLHSRRSGSLGRTFGGSSLGILARSLGADLQRAAARDSCVRTSAGPEDPELIAPIRARPPKGQPRTGCWRQRAYVDEEELVNLRIELQQCKRQLSHQSELRRVLQATLDSEREKSAGLVKDNEALQRAAEETLQGQRQVSDAETTELESQVDALLCLKRQLYQRIQALEQERAALLTQRQEAVSERCCIACLDHLANTVLLRCRHLCVCDECAPRVTECPICRQKVRDRLTVFMP